jgi:integrase
MRRRRYQKGSLKKRCGKWIGQWREEGVRRNQALGPVSSMTKSRARAELDKILASVNAQHEQTPEQISFGQFVGEVYYALFKRKWKRSTAANNISRIDTHLVVEFRERPVASLKREELQELLDRKAGEGLSFSMVDHLRWDLKQIFDLAVNEGRVKRNPAAVLFTPKNAGRAERRFMSIEEVRTCFSVLETRERLIVKLALLAGMRPGEIFALKWGRLVKQHADIRQRIYKGDIDSPKTVTSVRKAALSEGLLRDIEAWRSMSVGIGEDAWVFPSEKFTTPLSKDNCFRRHIVPRLRGVGLSWVNFQVMRRTHSSLMNALGIDGKLVADQLGHTLDVNQNVYTQVSVERRKEALDRLEGMLAGHVALNGVQRSTALDGGLKVIDSMERETGFEPATSSLGNRPQIENTDFGVYGVNGRR